MGNSSDNLADYWAVFRRERLLQGGGDNDRNASEGYPIITKGDTAYSLKVDASGSQLEFVVYTDTWKTVRAPLPETWRSEFHTVAGSYDGGRLVLSIDGAEVASPFRFDFWRPMTNNDEGAGYQRSLRLWRDAGPTAAAESVATTVRDGVVEVRSEIRIPAGDSTATVIWRFHPSGQIRVSPTVRLAGRLPLVPRIGMRCGISDAFARCTWHGRGPQENYADRHAGSWTGIHAGTVADLFHRYVDPQEAGLRTGVRWFELADPGRGDGFRIASADDQLLQFAVIPVSTLSLETARNAVDLVALHEYVVRIDHRTMGLGGTNSWGEQPLERYRIKPDGEYSWSFLITPLPSLPPTPRTADGP